MPGLQNGKGGPSDPNYVSRLLLDCVPVFHKIITPAYFAVPNRSLFIIPVANFCRRPKNYSYATGLSHRFTAATAASWFAAERPADEIDR